MTVLPLSDGKTPVGILRLFVRYTPNAWGYEDLHLAADAMDPVAEAVDKAGLPYDRFAARMVPEGIGYNDAELGTAYVERAAKRRDSLGRKDDTPDSVERARLAIPKIFA